MLLDSISHIRETYVGDQQIRASVFDMEEFSEERLLARLNEYVESRLDEWERGEGDAYYRASKWLNDYTQDDKQISRLMSAISNWQQKSLEEANIRDTLVLGLESLRSNRLLLWRRELRDWIDHQVESFPADMPARNHFNTWLLQWFDSLLATHHAKLPDMMERQLARLTDDELVELVETRVEDDLQMIRINGAAIGSIAGMILYLLTTVAERMWS